MSSDDNHPHTKETKEGLHSDHQVDILHAEVLASSDLMNDAFDGENHEHSQGLWQSVKSHPKACAWAFIMCFTIVSFLPVFTPLSVSSFYLSSRMQISYLCVWGVAGGKNGWWWPRRASRGLHAATCMLHIHLPKLV